MRYAACAKVAAAVIVLMAVTAKTPSWADPAVSGDQTAWQEISAALRKLEAISYRMKMTFPGQTVLVERVPPNSMRMITQVRGHADELESVTVGNETRSRVNGPNAPGTWSCGNVIRRTPPIDLIDLRDVLATVEVSRSPDTLIEGTPVHSYEITSTIQGNGQTDTTIFYIGTETGLPRRSITPYYFGPGNFVVDYYDYGAKIPIALAACL